MICSRREVKREASSNGQKSIIGMDTWRRGLRRSRCSPPAPAAASRGRAAARRRRLAERSADAGDFQTAETLYRQAFESNPGSVEALVGLGRSYAGLGQYARAEQALNEAKRRRPGDPDVLLELARTELGAGQAQAALANLDVAIRKRPRDVRIITARGIALDRLSRHAEAQATYRGGLERDPTDFALNSNLGLSLGLSGQTDAGIRILSELVRDGSANANTRGNLALVYGLAGREREARATLAGDLSPGAIQSNLGYYRELRAMLAKGKPIGNLGQPLQGTRLASAAPKAPAAAPLSALDPLTAIEPVAAAAVSLPAGSRGGGRPLRRRARASRSRPARQSRFRTSCRPRGPSLPGSFPRSRRSRAAAETPGE